MSAILTVFLFVCFLLFFYLILVCRLTFTCDELSGGCVVSKFKYGVREVDWYAVMSVKE